MIRFKCPHCRVAMQVADGAAGHRLACPACKQRLIVPSEAVSASPPAKAPPVLDTLEEMPVVNQKARLTIIVSIAGITLFLVAIIVVALFRPAESEPIKEAVKPIAQAKPVQVPLPTPPEPKPDPSPLPKIPIPPPKPVGPVWYDASDKKAPFLHSIGVQITAVRICNTALQTLRGETSSAEKFMQVELFIYNGSATKKIQYVGWSGDAFLAPTRAMLIDNFGNSHRHAYWSGLNKVVGQLKSTAIYPKEGREDVLIFDLPVERMEYLLLELPASAFGASDSFRFKIPRKMISGLP